ncbi:MAG: shikimate dehydrogenase, partial [Candidatus Bathyarchaeia archaeon]
MQCYLIGYPVEHSLSPIMHNTAFRRLGIDYRYEAVPVEPEYLGDFVEGTLRKSEVRGANVTIPYKVEVIKYLDEVDQEAAEIGAVNTIVNDEGSLKGYNTDGIGALRALKEAYGELEGRKVVLLGAGGAARAIAYHLVGEVEVLVILNRTEGKALKLMEELRERQRGLRVKVEGAGFSEDRLEEELSDADVVINATSVGMHPNVGQTSIPKELLNDRITVYDIVYNPLWTRL